MTYFTNRLKDRQLPFGSCLPGVDVSVSSDQLCDCGNDNSCNGLANEGCACCNGREQACTKADSCAGSQTCAGGTWGACGGGPELRCPDGWTDLGSSCEIWGGSNGVEMSESNNQWSLDFFIASGNWVSRSYVRIDYLGGGCHCSDTPDAVNVTCNDGWFKNFTQRESGCPLSPTGSVNWQIASSCSLTRIGGWTPFAQGACSKFGNLDLWLGTSKVCR